MKTELRRYLEDEFQSIGEQMPAWEQEVRDFWLHPEEYDLALWANPWRPRDVPESADGTISEKQLYHQLMHRVKPAMKYRQVGFQNVPTLRGHCKLYDGRQPGPHFMAAVMGGEIVHPRDIPTGAGIVPESYAHVEPLVNVDNLKEKLPVLENYDVSQSPVLQALLRGMEELYEITQGTVPFIHYAPTDLAAGVLGVTDLFMLMALDPILCLEFLHICNQKWHDIVTLQERAVQGRWANQNYEPGIIRGAWDNELTPAAHRQIMLPSFAEVAEIYGAITFHLGHSDSSLLKDYMTLPHVRACQIGRDWPMEPVLEQLPGKVVMQLKCNEHLHAGQTPRNLVQRSWEQVLEKFSAVAGRIRLQALVGHSADNPESHMEENLHERDILCDIWQAHSGLL